MIESCDRAIAPDGWKFQECTEEKCKMGRECTVVLTRISKKGDWDIDIERMGSEWRMYLPIKDSYVYINDAIEEGEEWIPMLYDVDIDKEVKGIGHEDISDAIREGICLAKFYDAGAHKKEMKYADPVALDALTKCRKASKISGI